MRPARTPAATGPVSETLAPTLIGRAWPQADVKTAGAAGWAGGGRDRGGAAPAPGGGKRGGAGKAPPWRGRRRGAKASGSYADPPLPARSRSVSCAFVAAGTQVAPAGCRSLGGGND